MKKIYLLLIAALFGFGAKAQMLTPTVIASTGAYAANGNYSLSYTVGEMTMVQTFTGGNNILTQGFQQPNDKVTGLIDITSAEFGSFVVYPNPAVDQFWFGFQLPEAGKVTVTMYDAIGQKISDIYYGNYESGKIVSNANAANLAAGMYLVTLTFTSNTDGQTHLDTKKLQVIR
jgi:Secretion system C-terminal sorting domain